MPEELTLESDPSTAERIERLTQDAARPVKIGNDEGLYGVVVRDDQRLALIDLAARYQSTPHRKTGTATVRTVEAFNEYLDDHDHGASSLWADPKARKVVAVINDDTDEDADYRDHRAVLDLGLTPEAEAVLGLEGRKFGQETFAEWLEQWGVLIAAPDAATIMEIVLTMEQTTNVSWRSSARLSDGQRRLSYEETVSTKSGEKGTLDVPAALTFVAPVYRGTSVGASPIKAMLRYRVEGADLTIRLVLVRPDEWLDAAFHEALGEISDNLGPILDGTPPAPVPVPDTVTTLSNAR